MIPGPRLQDHVLGAHTTVRGGIMELWNFQFETIESRIIHLESELPKKSMPEISLEDRQQKKICGLLEYWSEPGKNTDISCKMKVYRKITSTRGVR